MAIKFERNPHARNEKTFLKSGEEVINGMIPEQYIGRRWFIGIPRTIVEFQLNDVKLDGVREHGFDPEKQRRYNAKMADHLGVDVDAFSMGGKGDFGLPLWHNEMFVSASTLMDELFDAGLVLVDMFARNKNHQEPSKPAEWKTTLVFSLVGEQMEIPEETLSHLLKVMSYVWGNSRVWLNPIIPRDFDPASGQDAHEVVVGRKDTINLYQGRPSNGRLTEEYHLTPEAYRIGKPEKK